MSTLREFHERRAELTGLKSLLDTATDELFEKPLLLSKIEERERELKELENQPLIKIPDTELLLGGRAVAGSIGIDAKFAGAILESYQDMVSNHHGARLHPGMGKSGPRPGEQQSRLYLTALPRGSFGLRLSQPLCEDFISAQQVGEAMEELTTLVESAAAGDATFTQGVERFHPRVLIPLQKFLDTLASRESSVTIRSGLRETSLGIEQVKAASNRIKSTSEESTPVTLQGVFRGVLLETWRFDFVPEGQPTISGALAESITEEQAQSMLALCNQECVASLTSRRYRTHGTLSRPTYELVGLRSK